MSLVRLSELFFVRHRRTFLLVFLAAFAAAVAVTYSLPERYRATATLVVGENRPLATGATSVQLDEVLTRTYASLLETSGVERDVLRALPFPLQQGDLSGRVEFEVVSATRLIRIKTLDEDPRRAQQLANAYALTFVRRQQRSAEESGRDRLARLSARIGALAFEVRRLDQETTREGIDRRARAEAELEAARAAYATTQQNIALQGTNVAVASRATVPTEPATPRTKLLLALGLLFALALAAVAVLVRNVFDDRPEGEDELTALFGVPVLTRLPHERGGVPTARLQEALDVLRTVLSLQDRVRDPRRIAVTSGARAEGKTTVVQLLTTAFARAGERAVAVDCDLRRPGLAERFGVAGDRGVTTALVESRRDPIELVMPAPHQGVSVLPAGPPPPNPGVLLGLPRLGEIFSELGMEFDRVIIDTPPAEAGADAMTVTATVDGVIVVVDLMRARRRALRALRDELAGSGAPVLGLVLNRAPTGASYGYGPVATRTGAGPRITRATRA